MRSRKMFQSGASEAHAHRYTHTGTNKNTHTHTSKSSATRLPQKDTQRHLDAWTQTPTQTLAYTAMVAPAHRVKGQDRFVRSFCEATLVRSKGLQALQAGHLILPDYPRGPLHVKAAEAGMPCETSKRLHCSLGSRWCCKFPCCAKCCPTTAQRLSVLNGPFGRCSLRVQFPSSMANGEC